MDFKKYFKVLPAVAAMFFAVSCSNDNDKEIVSEPQGLVIPFEATVSSSMQTRADLNAENKYQFQAGDRLWVFGENISGELTLKAGDEGKTSGAIFTGSLNYTGEGSPASDLNLYAVLKGTEDLLLPETFDEFISGASINYENAIADGGPSNAVSKYSLFVTMNNTTFGEKTFTLKQLSSFLMFDVAFEDGISEDCDFSVHITNNGGEALYDGYIVTIEEDGAVKAKFSAAFLGEREDIPAAITDYLSLPSTTTLNNAAVIFDDQDAIPFVGDIDFNPVSNIFYRVNKCVYASSATYSITADATVLGTPYHSDLVGGVELPYDTDLKAVMTEMGIPAIYVTNCVLKSGNSISIGAFDAPNHNCTLSALRSGYSKATMTVGGSPVELTITVTKE